MMWRKELGETAFLVADNTTLDVKVAILYLFPQLTLFVKQYIHVCFYLIVCCIYRSTDHSILFHNYFNFIASSYVSIQ